MKGINKLTEDIIGTLPENILLTEDPNGVRLKNGKELKFHDSDAIAFMYIDDKLYVSNNSQIHMDILGKYIKETDTKLQDIVDRFGLRTTKTLPGRLWKNSKIISFWVYPDENRFKKIIKDLNKQKDIHIDDTWRIELNKYKIRPDDLKQHWDFDYYGSLIVPINDYMQGEDRKVSNVAMQHMLSPLYKTAKKIWKDKKLPKGMSQAEYNAMKTKYAFSENVITESPDTVQLKKNNALWNGRGARAFGWYKGNLSVGPNPNKYHRHLDQYFDPSSGITKGDLKLVRADFDCPGRLWLTRKLISFWKYPKPSEFKKLMKELGKHKYVNKDLFSKGWKVEIVPKKDGKPSLNVNWYDEPMGALIPTTEYVGSEERTQSELAKLHMLSPLFKTGVKKNMKTIKLPDGMSQAEYNYLITKYKFQESIILKDELITENPDFINSKTDGIWLSWNDNSAIPFGIYKGKLEIGCIECTHNEMEDENGNGIEREDLKYPGRLWEDEKVISFWVYPSQSEFKKIAQELKKNFRIDIFSNGWLIEVIPDKNGKFIDPKNSDWPETLTSILVPTKDYIGSKQRTKQELAKLHMLSPLFKKGGENSKMKSTKLPKGMSWAEAKYLMNKYKFQEEIDITDDELNELIIENPENVSTDDDSLDFDDNDARAFAWYKGKLYVADNCRQYHYELVPYYIKKKKKDVEDAEESDGYVTREKLEYPGRLWLKRKVMSFWKYPTESRFPKLMKQLGAHENIKTNLLSKDWKVEIVPNKEGKPIKIRDTDWDEYRYSVLIPTSQYAGSNKRTQSDLAKIHMLSPLFKKGGKNMKNIKLPPGMSQAEYNYLTTKYTFTENSWKEGSLVLENPDEIYDTKGTMINRWNDKDAYPFGWSVGARYCWVGPKGDVHPYADDSWNGKGWRGLKHSDWKKKVTRDSYSYSGRIWIKDKIISFWDIPKPNELKKFISDLEKTREIKIWNNGYKLELPIPESEVKKKGSSLIPLEYYGKEEEYYEKKWDKETRAKLHTLSPLFKTGGKNMKNIKLPPGMSQAEYNYLKTKYKFTEDIEISEDELNELLLKEYPDEVDYKNNLLLPEDKDAFSFGVDGTSPKNYRVWVSNPGKPHINAHDYGGRLWKKHKVISLWTFPKTKEELWAILRLVGSRLDIDFDKDMKWKIEIYGNNPEQSLGLIYDTIKSKIIPLYKFKQSENAPELRKLAHIKGREKFSDEPIYMKNIKLPKGMSKAEYNALVNKYKFQEDINVTDEAFNEWLFKENAEGIENDEKDVYTDFQDDDARAFGWYKGTLYVGENKSVWHDELIDYDLYDRGVYRGDLSFPGRLWLDSKVISFWEYPDKNLFKKLAKQLSSHKNIKTNILGKGWYIEIVPDKNKPGEIEKRPGFQEEGILIPTAEYAGSQQRSKSELAKLHMLSPLLKKGNKSNMKMKDVKLPKGMSWAEAKYLMNKYKFQENNELTGNQIKNIINDYLFKEDAVELMDAFFNDLGDGKELLKEVTAGPINGTDADDGPATWYVNYRHYTKEVKNLAEKGGMKIIDYLVTGVSKDYSNTDDYTDAIAVTFFPAGVPGESTPTNYADWKGTKAYNAWAKWIKNIALQLGFTFVHKIDALEKERAIDTTKNIKGVEPGIQAGKETRPLEEIVVDELLSTQKIVL